MKFIRFFFRILMAPVALLMTTFLVPLALLLALSTRVLAIISTIGVLLALLLFVTGDHHNGSIFLLLALLLNELRSNKFKRLVQTVSYLPHFISIMVVCGMIIDFTRSDGLINDIVEFFGGARKTMLLDPSMFRSIYIISDIWQGVGWGSIIYLSALTGIDTEQYEAAVIDGASRFQKVLYITLPGIAPTIVIMLIMRMGQMMNVGYEKIILLYNGNTYETADVISSFVYRKGLVEADYGYSTAIGLFNSSVNLLLLLITNTISRRVSETSLW